MCEWFASMLALRMKTADFPADKGTRIIGIIGILAGVFTIIFILGAGSAPPATPDQELSTFNAHQNSYAFYGVGTALFAAFFIPFAAGFSRIVRQKSPSVSSAAAFLVAAGVLTQAIANNLLVGSLFAISSAPSTATYATDATYFAAVVSNFTNELFGMVGILAGLGVLLFAWVIWKSEVFPKWLSYVLLVGGVLGILGSAPLGFVGFIFVLGLIVLGAVWGFGAGIVLLRSK
jgi:hypothetical protein